jgi:hypothetical protein
MKKDSPAAGKQDSGGVENQVLKKAKNVVMYEKRTDTNKTFVIHADIVTQQAEDIFFMEAFRMDRSDGMKIEGGLARYDTGANRIDVTGPMTVSTPDGWRAELTDARWDREEKHAATDRPVTVKGDRGTLRADRAEFFNDFKKIELSGNVHAQVAQKLLAD